MLSPRLHQTMKQAIRFGKPDRGVQSQGHCRDDDKRQRWLQKTEPFGEGVNENETMKWKMTE